MSKISLIAKLTVADGKESEFETALADLIATADVEDGLEVYSVHRSNEPGIYYFFEMYRDEDSFAAHGKGDEMKAAMGQLGAFLAARPEITVMNPVAAKGLDL